MRFFTSLGTLVVLLTLGFFCLVGDMLGALLPFGRKSAAAAPETPGPTPAAPEPAFSA